MSFKVIFIGLYLSALLIFLAHFWIVGKAVYGDGRYYYSYLPSIILHHTFDFSESFKLFGITSYPTPLGYQANKYSIGPALIWLPAFLFAHITLLPFNRADGYNSWYQVCIGVWNITLVFIGLFFLRKSLGQFFPKQTRNITLVFLFLSTNLLFYGAVDVINSHSASFFAACMSVYFWLKTPSVKSALLLGIFISVLALVRAQDMIFLLLPFTSFLKERRNYLVYFLLIIAAFFITYSPQFFLWHSLWGTWYVNPYLFHEHFYFSHPEILGVLFGKTSGLFLWTPLVICAVAGLFFFARQFFFIGGTFFSIFLLELYTIASWSTWWQGGSYSGRMFVSSLPILSFGLASCISKNAFKTFTLCYGVIFSILNPILIIIFLKFVK